MQKILQTLMLLLLVTTCFAQVSFPLQVNPIAQQSRYKVCYRVPADTAYHWVVENRVNFTFLQTLPIYAILPDSVETNTISLADGQYFWVHSREEDVVATWQQVGKLGLAFAKSRRYNLLQLFNEQENPVTEATILFAGRLLPQERDLLSFRLPTKKWEEEYVLAIAGEDTLIAMVEKYNRNNNYYYRRGIQNWKIVQSFLKIPQAIANIFKDEISYERLRKLRRKNKLSGFMVFNKPVYKPGDTLQMKAYVTNVKGKALTEPLDFQIDYGKNGQYKQINVGTIKPVSPGSYLCKLVLSDSFPSDSRYQVFLKGKSEFAALSSSFDIEEYQLPDISKFEWTVQQAQILAKDTFQFFASAVDALGLPLLNGQLDIEFVTQGVQKFYGDSLFVPDTLLRISKPLLQEGKTQIGVPANLFPRADVQMSANVTLRNSNNERVQKSVNVTLLQEKMALSFVRQANSFRVAYLVNADTINAKAILEMENDHWHQQKIIALPANIPFHPLAESYAVTVIDEKGRTLFWDDYDGDKGSRGEWAPSASPFFSNDTLGFVLANPGKQTVIWSVTRGKKVYGKGHTNAETFKWSLKASVKQAFHLQYAFINNGEEISKKLTIGLPYNWLQIKQAYSSTVLPGAVDTIKVSVTNYRNQPMAGINLSAFAYNQQLANKFKWPTLPLLHHYVPKKTWRAPTDVEETDLSLTDKDILYKLPVLQKAIGTDTMQYYQWLYDTAAVQIRRTFMKNVLPEIAVFAKKDGKPEPIYILYINNQPAWMYMLNTYSPYSFQVQPGYVKIGIRTANLFVERDSIYLPPFCKHEVILDVYNTANQFTKVKPMPDSLLQNERNLLSKYFLRVNKRSVQEGTWLWQESKVHILGSGDGDWYAGAFRETEEITAFKPYEYTTNFSFESNYTYQIGKSLVRLERQPLIITNRRLNQKKVKWRLGEEIPNIALPPTLKQPVKSILQVSTFNFTTQPDYATLQLKRISDSIADFMVLFMTDNPKNYKVFSGKTEMVHQLIPGAYSLMLVKNNKTVSMQGPFLVRSGGTNCMKVKPPVFTSPPSLLDSFIHWQNSKPIFIPTPAIPIQNESVADIPTGDFSITGHIKDAVTKLAIPGATVVIKGFKKGTQTDASGSFNFSNIALGNYTLVINCIGYESKSLAINAANGSFPSEEVLLKVSSLALDEVVVVGYGTTKKRDATGSIVTIEGKDMFQTLSGRLAGVNVTGAPGSSNKIMIRGASSISGNNQPWYVVDGVLMEELPSGLDLSSDQNLQMEVLNAQTATAIYGSRAANGVVIITTGRNKAPVIRTEFRDFAYWQPEILTDNNGFASIPIHYPDNVTNWQHAVYAAAPGGKYGRSFFSTNAFKVVQAQLTVPAFLLAGDSAVLSGNANNFGTTSKQLKLQFTVANMQKDTQLLVNGLDAAHVDLGVKAPSAPDTLHLTLTITDEKNTGDGEKRVIPILKKGAFETAGNFWVLPEGDTTLEFIPAKANNAVQLFAATNKMAILLEQLDWLIKYPYDCNEQMAHKLLAMQLNKQVAGATNKRFAYEKNMELITNKLLKNQLPSGGWSWWGASSENIFITTKVLQVLQQLPANTAIQSALRNGYLYLQNLLPTLSTTPKLTALYTLAKGGHMYPYQNAMDTIVFDSLGASQQWQYMYVSRKNTAQYATNWQKLWNQRTESVTGTLYWKSNQYDWFNNTRATMALAWQTILKDSLHQPLLLKIKQFFWEELQKGTFNTVEMAEIGTILINEALNEKEFFNSATVLEINGGDTKTVFPLKANLEPLPVHRIKKSGSGIVYLTTYQQWHNESPHQVDSIFEIKTVLRQQKVATQQLRVGEDALLRVSVFAKKSAAYVQLEIPIPAGCVYQSKPQVYGQHREYLKDKVLIFMEKVNEGLTQFDIPLETKFKGIFTLNPSQLQLMYFPLFFGRNELQQIPIR